MADALKYGLLACLGMAAWMLAEFALGLHGSRLAIGHYTSHGVEVILVLSLWRLHHHQLHTANRYWLPLWQAVLHGMLTSVVAAMGLYVFITLYLHYLNPFFPDNYLQWLVGTWRDEGITELVIRERAQAFRWSFGPVGRLLNTFGTCMLISLVASPLLALWLNWRRKEVVHTS